MMDAVEVYKEGENLRNEGKYEEAVARFEQAMELDPTYVMPYHAAAVCYSHLNQHEKAIEHARKACELDPQDPFCYMSLSVTYRKAFQGTQDMRYIQLAEDAMARAQALGPRR